VPDYSRAALAAAAGVDPWASAEHVQTGDPAGLEAGALRVRRAGLLAAEAADSGRRADLRLAGGFHNDGSEVFDAAASTSHGAVLLADRGEKIEETARALLDVAIALAEATTNTATRISTLDTDLTHIIGLRNGFHATGADPAALAAAVGAAELRYFQLAVDAVRAAGARVQAELDTYNAVLVNRTARLDALGYGQPAATPHDAAGAQLLSSASLGLPSVNDIVGAVYAAYGEAARDNPEAVASLVSGLIMIAVGRLMAARSRDKTAGLELAEASLRRATEAAAVLAAAAQRKLTDRTHPSRVPDPAAEPTGNPTFINEKEAPENKLALQRENESARTLARTGYAIEQNPTVPGDKNPDYRIEGKIFDNLALPPTDHATSPAASRRRSTRIRPNGSCSTWPTARSNRTPCDSSSTTGRSPASRRSS
jgi:hypothetical protein